MYFKPLCYVQRLTDPEFNQLIGEISTLLNNTLFHCKHDSLNQFKLFLNDTVLVYGNINLKNSAFYVCRTACLLSHKCAKRKYFSQVTKC